MYLFDSQNNHFESVNGDGMDDDHLLKAIGLSAKLSKATDVMFNNV